VFYVRFLFFFFFNDTATTEIYTLSLHDALPISNLHDPWLWVALLLGLLLIPRRRERFVLLATTFQILFYVGAYFVTPHDPGWHIATSWPRLTMQIAAPLAYAVMVQLAHAEARSGQP